jgi:1-acyl-sn-glycerol-3-phosphate acyltransferase
VVLSLYNISGVLARIILFFLGPLHVLHRERSRPAGARLFACNHISHFDPVLLGLASHREIDFMAMEELFRNPVMAAYCRATYSFPTDRSRVDKAAVRTALKRLGAGRVVGIFPEGGIRVREESILNGAPMRPGVVSLASMADVEVVPCVLLGADALYNWRRWLPFRRNRFWIIFGEPLRLRADLPAKEARLLMEKELAAAFPALCKELMETYKLGPEVLPRTPEEHWS